MLRLYDKNHNAIGHIIKYKECKIESEVSTGDKTLSFTYLAKHHNLKNEMYIRTQIDEYVIKEISESSDGFPQIVAILNLEDLKKDSWQTFNIQDVTIDEAARTVLVGTGWTVVECDVTKRRNAGMVQVSSLDVIQNLCTAFMCEPVFDTINKTISFYSQRGEDKGVYFMSGLNLKKLQKKSSSYDYCTRIIPLGADGLTIESVNEGKKYLENYQYSSKVLTYIWKDESYTEPQALMEDAELKLNDLSKPETSYSAEIRDLAKQKPEYSILSFALGDTITLIDKETGTREKQRIKKLTEYPQDPNKNTCEIANTVLTFEEMQEKYQAAAAIVNYTISNDGKIRVSDILHFEDGVSGSSTIGGIQNNIEDIQGELSLVKLTVGEIDANYLSVEEAYLRYATIDLANIENGCIKTAMIDVGAVNTAQIADGSITDAKIVDLTANKITAGILSVERLEIRGSTSSIVYALNNITGALQSQNVDTLNGETLTERTITADKIVANAITANEIAAKTITANNIAANTITGSEIAADAITAINIASTAVTTDKLAANAVTAEKIATDAIKSRNYKYTSGNYSDDGTFLDLLNGMVRSKNFAIDSSGNAYFKGALSGATGSFSGSITAINAVIKDKISMYAPNAWGDDTQYDIIKATNSTGQAPDLQIGNGSMYINLNGPTRITGGYAELQVSGNIRGVGFTGTDYTCSTTTNYSKFTNSGIYINTTNGAGSVWNEVQLRLGGNSGSQSFSLVGYLDGTQAFWHTLADASGNTIFQKDLTVSGTISSSKAVSVPGISYTTGQVALTNKSYTCGLYDLRFGPTIDFDNQVNLGISSARWVKVYAASGTIGTSDERDKDIIGAVDDRYKHLYMALEPIVYRWKDTGIDKKAHIGLGAQTTERSAIACGIALSEIGMIEHDYWDEPSRDGRTDRYGMNYQEVAVLTVPIVQEHEKRLNSHDILIDTMEGRISGYGAVISCMQSREEYLQSQLAEALERISNQNTKIAQHEAEINRLAGMIEAA